MKEIPLTKGLFTIVDDDDYLVLCQFKWCAQQMGHTFYAVRRQYSPGYIKGKPGGSTYIRMHRFILAVPVGQMVDHIDGNGLNNTRSNLRICSHTENMRNRVGSKKSRSTFKGVSWCRIDSTWEACIRINHRTIHLGHFPTEIGAARAYDQAAIRLHGEFARINGV